MWHVYILKSLRKKWYYVGSTNRLNKRIKEHNALKVQSTKAFAPFILVRTIKYSTEHEARHYEQRVKKQRLLKEELIKNVEL